MKAHEAFNDITDALKLAKTHRTRLDPALLRELADALHEAADDLVSSPFRAELPERVVELIEDACASIENHLDDERDA